MYGELSVRRYSYYSRIGFSKGLISEAYGNLTLTVRSFSEVFFEIQPLPPQRGV